ncbi:hypothetical protein GF337_07860 [candidate division KSB1 bacterium]|nr:hypothetical protein [candidate division KSB1 bacterium]
MKFIMSGIVLLGTLVSLALINLPSVSRQDTGYNKIQRKAFFEQLSVQYYGTPKYYHHLNAINKKVNINRLQRHTDIIIPTLDAIKNSHYRDLLQTKQNLQKSDDHQSTWFLNSPLYGSIAIPPLGIIAIFALAIGILIWRIKARRNVKTNDILNFFKTKSSKKEVEIIHNRDEFLVKYKINKK